MPSGYVPTTAEEKADAKAASRGGTILAAAIDGNLPAVRHIVRSDAEAVHQKDDFGATALMLAADNGHLSIAQFLVQSKADVNAKRNDCATALIFAADNGHLSIAQFLVQSKADVNAKRNDCGTPLTKAAAGGQLSVAQFLVESKADVNAKKNDGKTALDRAREESRTDVVAFLELAVKAMSLLNKICPDNLTVIVDQLASIKLVKAKELEWVIRIIFKKARAEPHYCETYADVVFALKERYPQFPAENENEKPATFTRVLLNSCQDEFENMPATFEATDEERVKFPNPEELQQELKRKKDMMLANMKFIGHLFLRQLLVFQVIGQVVHDLIGIKENGSQPEEHKIECVCELLQAVGYTLDETTHGENLMNSFQARLKDLSKQLLGDGKQAFSKRIRFAIEDLLDLRRNKWQRKVFKEQAKTKNEVKVDAVASKAKDPTHLEAELATTKAELERMQLTAVAASPSSYGGYAGQASPVSPAPKASSSTAEARRVNVRSTHWYPFYRHTVFQTIQSCFADDYAEGVVLIGIQPDLDRTMTCAEWPSIQEDLFQAFDEKKYPFYQKGEKKLDFTKITFKRVELQDLGDEINLSTKRNKFAVIASCCESDFHAADEAFEKHNKATPAGHGKVRRAWATEDVYGRGSHP